MRPDRARVLTEGLIVGFIGYLAVAVFFAAVNGVSGRHLFTTAALLGQALTGGPANAASVVIDPRAVLAYNAVHLLIFLAIGVAVSVLVFATERHPNAWVLFFLLFVALLMATSIAFSVAVGPLSDLLPWWSLAGSNLSAALAMGAYVVYRHPTLWAAVAGAEA